MTANEVLRTVANRLPPETRMTGFRDTVRETMRRIRAHGDRLGGWSFDWTRGIIDLLASESAGTAAVTNGSADVVGTGTTWTAAMVGRKFRVSGVPYVIDTRTDDTHIALTTVYGGTTDLLATYTIYQDEYATTANLTVIQRIWDLENNSRLKARTGIALGNLDHLSESSGTVQQYSLAVRNSSGVLSVQLHPYPTAIARLEYWYQADITQIADIGDTIDVPGFFDELVKQGCFARQLELLGARTAPQEKLNFREMLQEAYMADNPLRDEKIRMARDDMLDPLRFEVKSQRNVTVP